MLNQGGFFFFSPEFLTLGFFDTVFLNKKTKRNSQKT